MIAALLAVIANTGNILLDKSLLSRQRMAIHNYIPLVFVFLFFVTLLTLPWTGSINSAVATDQQYIFYFVLMILLALIWNIFYYQGLQREKIMEFEMTMLLTPLATIILATLFFPEEFNGPVFASAIIGSLALFATHLRKHHLHLDKYEIHLILAVFLMAMETMVQRELLEVYSPALLYAIRTGVLAAFFALYYKPNMHAVTNRQFNTVFLIAVMGALGMVSKFYGYQTIGITFTTLLLLLVPILSSWIDTRVNKTRVKKRTVVAFVVILMCVVYGVLAQPV